MLPSLGRLLERLELWIRWKSLSLPKYGKRTSFGGFGCIHSQRVGCFCCSCFY
jgi:hypothetical protein